MISLEPERCLPLTPRQASRLVCHSGVVWVTREGDLRDFFLGAGDTLDLHAGVTLVSAVEPAAICLVPPGSWWRTFATIAGQIRWRRRAHA
jgi:hypothetical protein